MTINWLSRIGILFASLWIGGLLTCYGFNLNRSNLWMIFFGFVFVELGLFNLWLGFFDTWGWIWQFFGKP